MGGSTTTATTTVKNLPDYAQPYAQELLKRSEAIAFRNYVQYTKDTGQPIFALQNANEVAGISALALRGRTGNTTIQNAISLIQDILNGVYLNGTEPGGFFQGALVLFHDNLATAITTDLVPLLGGTKFAMGDVEAANLAQSLASTTLAKYSGRGQAKLYADNYRASRTDQHQALAVGLEFGNQPIRNAEILRGAGLMDRIYRQESDTTYYKYWVDLQIGAVARLEVLGNAIRALVGAQITKTEPYFAPSPAIGMAGGAISGAASGAMIGAEIGVEGGGPYGAAIGAVVGLGVGYLSSRK